MNNITPFLALVDEMTSFFKDYAEFSKEKLLVVKDNNVIKLEEMMKVDQANMLKLKGYDRKREKLISDIWGKELTFRQIVEIEDGDRKKTLADYYNKLDIALLEFKSISEATNQFIELNMHTLNKKLTALRVKENPIESTYDKQGKVSDDAKREFKSTKI